jgi:hypothetical protein
VLEFTLVCLPLCCVLANRGSLSNPSRTTQGRGNIKGHSTFGRNDLTEDIHPFAGSLSAVSGVRNECVVSPNAHLLQVISDFLENLLKVFCVKIDAHDSRNIRK